jgi:hypothetical protein
VYSIFTSLYEATFVKTVEISFLSKSE